MWLNVMSNVLLWRAYAKCQSFAFCDLCLEISLTLYRRCTVAMCVWAVSIMTLNAWTEMISIKWNGNWIVYSKYIEHVARAFFIIHNILSATAFLPFMNGKLFFTMMFAFGNALKSINIIFKRKLNYIVCELFRSYSICLMYFEIIMRFNTKEFHSQLNRTADLRPSFEWWCTCVYWCKFDIKKFQIFFFLVFICFPIRCFFYRWRFMRILLLCRC